MKKVTLPPDRKKKKHYYVMLHGEYMGETWAVSPEKGRVNFWWKFAKNEDEYTVREYNPEDFDIVEA